MKTLLSIIIIIGFSYTLCAQTNLVLNPQFTFHKDMNSMYMDYNGLFDPNTLSNIKVSALTTIPNDWTDPTNATPDYFCHEALTNEQCTTITRGMVWVPNNCLSTGVNDKYSNSNAYAGIMNKKKPNQMASSKREYIMGRLSCEELQEGTTYNISFDIRLADISLGRARSIGIYFHRGMWQNNGLMLSLGPAVLGGQQLFNQLSRHTSDDPALLGSKNEWKTVNFTYTALGGEKYFIIGCFDQVIGTELGFTTDGVNTSQAGDCSWYPSFNNTTPDNASYPAVAAYYFIDNVSITEASNLGCCSICESHDLDLQPENPQFLLPDEPAVPNEQSCCSTLYIRKTKEYPFSCFQKIKRIEITSPTLTTAQYTVTPATGFIDNLQGDVHKIMHPNNQEIRISNIDDWLKLAKICVLSGNYGTFKVSIVFLGEDNLEHRCDEEEFTISCLECCNYYQVQRGNITSLPNGQCCATYTITSTSQVPECLNLASINVPYLGGNIYQESAPNNGTFTLPHSFTICLPNGTKSLSTVIQLFGKDGLFECSKPISFACDECCDKIKLRNISDQVPNNNPCCKWIEAKFTNDVAPSCTTNVSKIVVYKLNSGIKVFDQVYTNVDLVNGVLLQLCTDKKIQRFVIKFFFNDGTTCEQQFLATCPLGVDCCKAIKVNVTESLFNNDPVQCCFNINLQKVKECSAKTVKIFNSNNLIIMQYDIPSWQLNETKPTFSYCVPRPKIEVLRIQIYDNNNNIICTQAVDLTCSVAPSCCDQYSIGAFNIVNTIGPVCCANIILNKLSGCSSVTSLKILDNNNNQIAEYLETSIQPFTSTIPFQYCWNGNTTLTLAVMQGVNEVCRKSITLNCEGGSPGNNGNGKEFIQETSNDNNTNQSTSCLSDLSLIALENLFPGLVSFSSQTNGVCTIVITDLQGQPVYSSSPKPIMNGMNKVPLELGEQGLLSGVYLLHIRTQDCSISSKFVYTR